VTRALEAIIIITYIHAIFCSVLFFCLTLFDVYVPILPAHIYVFQLGLMCWLHLAVLKVHLYLLYFNFHSNSESYAVQFLNHK
jgi:hypothetical protein